MCWHKWLVARGAHDPLCRAEMLSFGMIAHCASSGLYQSVTHQRRSCCCGCDCALFSCRLPRLLLVERREWWITMLVPLLTWHELRLQILDGNASFNWAAKDTTLIVRATPCSFIISTTKLAATLMVSGVTPVAFIDTAHECCLSSMRTKPLA